MRILILFTALILPLSVFGQFEFQPQFGYATFRMKEMTEHLEELSDDFPVDAKITNRFPGYWYYELIGSYTFRNNLYSGVCLSYGSTGGRAHYSDYSGEISANLLVKGITIVPIVGWRIPSQRDDHVYILQLRTGLIVGTYALSVQSEIGTHATEDNFKFKSMNLIMEPGFRYTKMITNWVGANAYVGYNLNLAKGHLFFDADGELFLQDQNQNAIHLDWTGFRASFGLTIKVFGRKE